MGRQPPSTFANGCTKECLRETGIRFKTSSRRDLSFAFVLGYFQSFRRRAEETLSGPRLFFKAELRIAASISQSSSLKTVVRIGMSGDNAGISWATSFKSAAILDAICAESLKQRKANFFRFTPLRILTADHGFEWWEYTTWASHAPLATRIALFRLCLMLRSWASWISWDSTGFSFFNSRRRFTKSWQVLSHQGDNPFFPFPENWCLRILYWSSSVEITQAWIQSIFGLESSAKAYFKTAGQSVLRDSS